jgi:hypothetical protein
MTMFACEDTLLCIYEKQSPTASNEQSSVTIRRVECRNCYRSIGVDRRHTRCFALTVSAESWMIQKLSTQTYGMDISRASIIASRIDAGSLSGRKPRARSSRVAIVVVKDCDKPQQYERAAYCPRSPAFVSYRRTLCAEPVTSITLVGSS